MTSSDHVTSDRGGVPALHATPTATERHPRAQSDDRRESLQTERAQRTGAPLVAAGGTALHASRRVVQGHAGRQGGTTAD